MNYSKESIEQIARELRVVVDDAIQTMELVSDEEASHRPGPGKWSKKEIIGHLLDSAANNHQRFVRAPKDDVFVFPGYAQDDWVNVQQYNDQSWTELLDFWKCYNYHIAHIIKQIPETAYDIECRIGSYEPASLAFLVDDYLVHLKHHLKAISN